MIQMVALAFKDCKTTMINIFKKIEEKKDKMNEMMEILTRKLEFHLISI